VLEPRALFIDESGDAEQNLVLSALQLPAAVVETARAETEELIGTLRELLPGFARVSEMHANHLARPLTPTEIEGLAGEPAFRTHERQFVYQHALHHLSGLPGAQVYTVMWRWKGSFAPRGRSGGRRFRDLLIELLAWVAEDPAPVAAVVIDKAGQAPWYEKALATAQEQAGEVWDVAMADSRDDLLVQLVDLAAYAAYQSAIPGTKAGNAEMVSWYRSALSSNFAEGGDGYGLRHFTGNVTPAAK
jgi:hypothetical protein